MEEEQIIKANNAFSIDLYAKLKELEKNLFFSPFSIFTALSMAYAGAHGLTEIQMKETLHITLNQDRLHSEFKKLLRIFYGKRGSELNLANLMCVQKGYKLLKKYLLIIDDNYRGKIWELDFKAVKKACAKINAWVKKHTRGKIKNIIDTIEDDLIVILINAIYFKGTWDSTFEKRYTNDEIFTLASGKNVLVPMMHQIHEFPFLEEDNFQILEMPYKKSQNSSIVEQKSMIIFLPTKRNGLEELEKTLTIEQIINHLSRLQKLKKRKIKVIFPRFKIETRYELIRPLQELGITDAFTDRADFSGIATFPPLHISGIIHKAFVDVNERGTEAAAVTAVLITGSSLGPKQEPPEFRADHPFLFLIIDSQTRSILFIGKLMNPKA